MMGMAVEHAQLESLRFRGTLAEVAPIAPPPPPGPGEVLLRPAHLLLGSLDRRILRGELPFAGTLGRDGLFVVTEVGPGVDRSLIDRRVVVEAFVSCMTCDVCRGGLRHLCLARTARGLHGADGLGAMLVTAKAVTLVEVPAAITTDQALVAQSLAGALHAVRTASLDSRGYVTILGDGLMGILAAQVAATINPTVRLLGKHPDRFMLCERLGVKHRHVVEVGRRHDQAVVIDCTGDASTDDLLLASDLVAPKGRIVVKTPPVRLSMPSSRGRGDALAACASLEATIHGATAGTLRDAINFLLRTRINTDVVLTRRFPWERCAEALDALHDRRSLAVVIDLPRP
jgi:threonine dehydrogenase-like Zn-dependent dehydrogenase